MELKQVSEILTGIIKDIDDLKVVYENDNVGTKCLSATYDALTEAVKCVELNMTKDIDDKYTFEDVWYMLKQCVLHKEYKNDILREMINLEMNFIFIDKGE